MKRMIMIALAFLTAGLMLAGCAAPKQITRADSGASEPTTQSAVIGGLVPMDIENPTSLEQEVLIFWGSDSVAVVPDPRTGKWMYSRPAIMTFRVWRANSEYNWHNYVRTMLPRNSSFMLVGRTMNFWGKGSPYSVPFSTGSAPFAYRYNMVVPTYPLAEAGGLVTLQNWPIMTFGNGPLQIEYVIDLRAVGISGLPIAREITNRVYGR